MLIEACPDCNENARVMSCGLDHWVICPSCYRTGYTCNDFGHEDAVAEAIASWNEEAKPPREHPAVAVLNRLFEADPDAIHAMIMNRVPCNDRLAADPAGPTMVNPSTGNGMVGLLGILNSILEEMGSPKVAYQYKDTPNEHGTHHVVGFQVYRP